MVLPTASKCEENRRRLSTPSCGILARKVPFARLVTTGSAILVNVLYVQYKKILHYILDD